MYLDAGTGPIEHLGWRDQRGNRAALGLDGDGGSFVGHAQRVGEGAIGYRGTGVDPSGVDPSGVDPSCVDPVR